MQLLKATQLPKAAYARGIWGHAPQENFEFNSSEIAFQAILGVFIMLYCTTEQETPVGLFDKNDG